METFGTPCTLKTLIVMVFGPSGLYRNGNRAKVEIEFDTPELDERSPWVRKNHSYNNSTDIHFRS